MIRNEFNKSLVDRIVEDIKIKILKGDIDFGEKIDVNILNKEYGVSSTPVRDALNRLEQTGLVLINPRVGYFVNKYSKKDIKDIFELRNILEVGALRIAITNLEEEVLKKSIQITEEIIKKDFNYKKLIERLREESPHLLVIRGCKNVRLQSAYYKIYDQIEVLLSRHPQGKDSFNVHLEIKKAILNKDFDLSKKFLEEHLDNVKNDLLDLMKF